LVWSVFKYSRCSPEKAFTDMLRDMPASLMGTLLGHEAAKLLDKDHPAASDLN
jgi:hypothetical protein